MADTTESCDGRLSMRRDVHGVLVYIGSAAEFGAPAGQRLWTIDAPLTIGRLPPKGNWTIDDRRLSRQHARVSRQGSKFWLEDLGSRNGTLIDGVPSRGRTRLREGAIVFMAGHAAVFRLMSDQDISRVSDELSAPLGPVPSASGPMARSLRRLRSLAMTPLPILLTGETGVGKEVFASAVHDLSARVGKLQAINCAALPTELVESELFGYERGAHSQARERKPGLIEQAEGGTLFLDEVGDMPTGAQAKLLRFLESLEVRPLGGLRAVKLNVRTIAATSHIEANGEIPGLRPDLAARLAAEPVSLPPLRARVEDIGALSAYFVRGTDPVALTPSAFLSLCLYDWPRNVRELQRVIRESRNMAVGAHAIDLEHLPPNLTGRAAPARVKRRSPRPLPTREDLSVLLTQHRGNIAEVARVLDRQWAVVFRAVERYGLGTEGSKRN